jgi:pteridine reductase
VSPTGKTALVTGGAVRLGRAMVEQLARSGWRVAFTYRSSAAAARQLEAALAAEGCTAVGVRADLADPAERRRLVEEAAARFGGLDGLVNNAAIFPRTPLEELDEAALGEALRVNLEAPVLLAVACRDMLRQRHGAIVNLADIHGLFPLRHHLAYSVSKAALIAATRSLALELAPEVRVNAVAPGIALFPESYGEGTRETLVARTPLRRAGGAEEIARAVSYLLEGSETITGQVLVLDGGRTIAL